MVAIYVGTLGTIVATNLPTGVLVSVGLAVAMTAREARRKAAVRTLPDRQPPIPPARRTTP